MMITPPRRMEREMKTKTVGDAPFLLLSAHSKQATPALTRLVPPGASLSLPLLCAARTSTHTHTHTLSVQPSCSSQFDSCASIQDGTSSQQGPLVCLDHPRAQVFATSSSPHKQLSLSLFLSPAERFLSLMLLPLLERKRDADQPSLPSSAPRTPPADPRAPAPHTSPNVPLHQQSARPSPALSHPRASRSWQRCMFGSAQRNLIRIRLVKQLISQFSW